MTVMSLGCASITSASAVERDGQRRSGANESRHNRDLALGLLTGNPPLDPDEQVVVENGHSANRQSMATRVGYNYVYAYDYDQGSGPDS
jgi:hypothetical protein